MNSSTPKAKIRPNTWETRPTHNILASLHIKLSLHKQIDFYQENSPAKYEILSHTEA